jgi:glycosyltransferase involved in cell wall biosynthesis
MKPPKLTVFTEPIHAEDLIGRIKSFLRPLKYFLQGQELPAKKTLGGHYAVTRSLVQGLKKTGVDFNYNPSREKDIAENVIVLAGVERLKQAINLKNKGKIRMLLAGPNVVEDVRSENGIVANEAIDRYIVPSEWVKDLVIEDCGRLKDRVLCWSAGVDSEYWKPTVDAKDRKQVLIYWKTEPEEFCNEVIKFVREEGMNPALLQYGKYSVEEYKGLLDRSAYAIFISRSESQGIALAEAWSMNVPTLVFDPGEFFFGGRTIYNVSACPYLTPSTGLNWKTLAELRNIIRDKNSFTGFKPREYVLKRFTDEYSARQLIENLIPPTGGRK